MRPYLDKVLPDAWKAAQAFTIEVDRAVLEQGLTSEEVELINVRASQLNGCAFCLDLHSRLAREAGVTPQKIDILPAWRESTIYSEREKSVLAIAEAATHMPLTEEAKADLSGARSVLGDEQFAAAEWVASAINMFNRISILSTHPVRPRDADGKVVK